MMRAATAAETNNGSFLCPISGLAPGKLHNISFTRMKLFLMNGPQNFYFCVTGGAAQERSLL